MLYGINRKDQSTKQWRIESIIKSASTRQYSEFLDTEGTFHTLPPATALS